MRVYDILNKEEPINEAPVGAVKQGLRRVGSKAAGAVGMSRTAGNLGAKADTGAEANKLEKGFSTFLGKQMKDLKTATAQDLAKYLQQKGYPTNHLKGMSGVLQTSQIDDLVLKSVSNKAAGDDVPGVGGDDAQTTKAQQPAGKKKQGAVSAFKQGFQKGQGKNTAKTASAPKKIPKKIKSSIEKLSDQEKQQLVKIL